MLKRPFVSLFYSLKLKNKRYYWVPPNLDENNKIYLIKQKYDIPKELLDIIEFQEKNIKDLNRQLTNQKKVIEKIHETVEHINVYNYDTRIVQTLILFNLFFNNLFKI